jgi:hypothetical protein
MPFHTRPVPISTIKNHVLVHGDFLQQTVGFDVSFKLGEASVIHHRKRFGSRMRFHFPP